MSFLKNFNRCDLFVGIWALYMLQGVLYPQGIINQLLQLIMILWGMIVFGRYVFKQLKLSPFLKSVSMLCLMYIIYGVINILCGREDFGSFHVSSFIYLKNSLNSLLPIFVFYDLSRRGFLTTDKIKKYIILFIPLTVVLFVKFQSLMLLDSGKDEMTNNLGYMFVSLLPYVYFFYRRPLFQYVIIGILMTFVAVAVKRGAILIFILGTVYFLFTTFKNGSRRKKIVNILLLLILITFVYYLIQYRIEASEYFALRIESTIDGDSSGRDVIYNTIWNEIIQETNVFEFLFGRGANSTIAIAGNYAHQDWLETLCNNGVLGGVVILYFFVSLLGLIKKSYRAIDPYMFDSFLTLSFIILAKTIFSMSIQNLDLYQSLLLGFLVYESTKSCREDLSLIS